MKKQSLKEELVDLRMKLAEAENQALKITHQFVLRGYHWSLVDNAHTAIQKADNKLCKLAKILGLDKLDVVKPKELSNAK